MVPPDSHGDFDRGTREFPRRLIGLTYKAITFFGQLFHVVLLPHKLPHWAPTTPPHFPKKMLRFGLLPFRSPLLRQSLLISLPPPT